MTPEQRERKKETDRLYRERSTEKIAELQRRYYTSVLKPDPDFLVRNRAYSRQYYAENKVELGRIQVAKYQAKKEADPTFRAGKRGRPKGSCKKREVVDATVSATDSATDSTSAAAESTEVLPKVLARVARVAAFETQEGNAASGCV